MLKLYLEADSMYLGRRRYSQTLTPLSSHGLKAV